MHQIQVAYATLQYHCIAGNSLFITVLGKEYLIVIYWLPQVKSLAATKKDLFQLTRSGLKPKPRSSRTLFCVGLVFCSPVDFGCENKVSVHLKIITHVLYVQCRFYMITLITCQLIGLILQQGVDLVFPFSKLLYGKASLLLLLLLS